MNRRRLRHAFVLTIVAATVLVGGCSRAETAEESRGVPQEIHSPDGTGGINHPDVRDRDYVVLVSFDGFRHDYLDKFETPGFDQLAASGVTAEALVPVFPSLTFPSHYSIATGMYPAHHGIVGNRFYDPYRDDDFDYRDSDDAQDGSWWGAEPIWLTAERQGMVAAAFFWPGTEAPIGGLRPSQWRAFDGGVANSDRVNQVIKWLRLSADERPHIITVYFSTVDRAGHLFGPNAPALGRSIRAADRLLSTLTTAIDELPYGDRVNLIVVSDHGMAAVDPERQVIIGDVADLRGVRSVFLGPGLSLHLPGDPSRAMDIRDTFNRRVAADDARAYLRSEAPRHLQIADNARFGDVVVVPTEGGRVAFRRDSSSPAGMHGWDPSLPSMHGIFLARGRAIEPGQTIPAFENIHIYPLLAEMLDLTPNRDIDGDLSVLGPLVGGR